MRGADFEKWRAEWERSRAAKAAWDARIESTSGGGSGEAPRAGEEEAEEDDPLFLQAVAASERDAAEAARVEVEEEVEEKT
jgi:hypothetical protein